MKKSGESPSKKLLLSQETVKQLNPQSLASVAGGMLPKTEEAHCSELGGCVPRDP